MKKKLISIFCVLFFLTLSSYSSYGKYITNEEAICYGFIVSYNTYENITLQNNVNCKMRHLVNDLLREKIPVYWTAENLTIDVKLINSSDETKFFEKGAFVIPFTGNETIDKKIIAMIYNYNQTSEINQDLTKVPVYYLLQKLNIFAYKLNEINIASHKSKVTTGEIAFLEISNKCGFLSFDYLYDNEISDELNNSKYNLFIHAGGASEYATFLKSSMFYQLFAGTFLKEIRTVRNFVANGGGYIGSCYGCEMAGAGYDFGLLKVHFKRVPYNPKLPSIGIYSMADYICTPPPGILDAIQVKVVNNSHPVTFHLDPIITDFHFGGARITYVGKNVEVLSQYYETDTEMDDTPSWLSSNFGKGKLVTFSPHPEIMGYYESDISHIGKTVLSNAIFYTTSDGLSEVKIDNNLSISFIESIFLQTKNLKNNTNLSSNFNQIINKINETKSELLNLRENANELMIIIKGLALEENINITDKHEMTYLGYKSIWVSFEYYYKTFLSYFENITNTLNGIEEVYTLIKNNSGFNNTIQKLKIDINSRINNSNKIIEKGIGITKDYKEKLLNYKNSIFRTKLKQITLTDLGHEYYWNLYKIFSYLPQIYFNCQKTLRSNWYNFEANSAI